MSVEKNLLEFREKHSEMKEDEQTHQSKSKSSDNTLGEKSTHQKQVKLIKRIHIQTHPGEISKCQAYEKEVKT